MILLAKGIEAVERGLVPDALVRAAIRRMCRQRLMDCDRGSSTSNEQWIRTFLQSTLTSPIAPVPEKANEQHYELPPEFFAAVLGPHRKYSACFWPNDRTTLAEAETQALEITCQRADLADGQDVLELGCGWGSLSLWMATRFPRSRITAVSNSNAQRHYIEEEAKQRGLPNLKIVTADMNQFQADGNGFDRVVSVEMFEHMRNLDMLLERIAGWLRSDGKLFVHHFCHREYVYPFETEGDVNWMGRYFFSGGLMPCERMLHHFDRSMSVIHQWLWDGTHYQRTAEAWLDNLDAARSQVMPILDATYGRRQSHRWLHRWRMFFMAVAELFGYAHGQEWYVSHSLLQPIGK